MSRKKWTVLVLTLTTTTIVVLACNYYYIKNNSFQVNAASLVQIDSIKTLATDVHVPPQKTKYIRFEDIERRKYKISNDAVEVMGNSHDKFNNANLIIDILTDTSSYKNYLKKNTDREINVYGVIIEGESLINIDSLNEQSYKRHVTSYFVILLISGMLIIYCSWKKMNAEK